MKKIVLISVGQPSTNPRLVKEANVLQQSGFEVHVVYSFVNQWAWEADKLLFTQVDWTPVLAGGSPYRDRSSYLLSRLGLKFFEFIARNLTFKFGIAERAKGRTYPALLKKAKSLKADLYIAHILAALPAAVNAAKKNGAMCGFDAEDFHRFEVDNETHTYEHLLSVYIEDKYIPRINYLTVSSPGIGEAYHALYKKAKPVTLLNVFPISHQISPCKQTSKTPIKLFWFSQTIGGGRGLANCINALNLINDPAIELHLLGFVTSNDKQQLTSSAKSNVTIFFYPPVPPDKIVLLASRFDIGLAPEECAPYNRQVCLTNKIFTYMQAGLAIIASDTAAQQELLKSYPGLGIVYGIGNSQALANQILFYLDNRQALLNAKKVSYRIAQTELNWEMESRKFLKVVNEVLKN